MSYIDFEELKQEFGLARFRDAIYTLNIIYLLTLGSSLIVGVIAFCALQGYGSGLIISIHYNWLNTTVTFDCY